MIRTLARTLALAAALPVLVLPALAQDAPPEMSPEEAAMMAASAPGSVISRRGGTARWCSTPSGRPRAGCRPR